MHQLLYAHYDAFLCVDLSSSINLVFGKSALNTLIGIILQTLPLSFCIHTLSFVGFHHNFTINNNFTLLKLKIIDPITSKLLINIYILPLSLHVSLSVQNFSLSVSLDTFLLVLWHTLLKWFTLLHHAEFLYAGHLHGLCMVPHHLQFLTLCHLKCAKIQFLHGSTSSLLLAPFQFFFLDFAIVCQN